MELKELKGAGPKTIEYLNKAGISDIRSLLFTFPKSYAEYKLGKFNYFDSFNAKCTIIEKPRFIKLKNVSKTDFRVMIDDLEYSATAFNMQYIAKTFDVGDECVIIGTYSKEYRNIQVEKLINIKNYKEGIVPEYNIEGITNPSFSKLVSQALPYYNAQKPIIPQEYFEKYGYKTGIDLLKSIHFPTTLKESELSINALKYSELLSFSIKLAIMNENSLSLRNTPTKYDIALVKEMIKTIPFELTDDQKKSVNDIFKTMKSDIPLNMLLEGDVGSGKTIVALISMYAVKTAKRQSLLIAPTEALASQHFETFSKFLNLFDTKIALLTSSTKQSERKKIIQGTLDGTIDIIIGTHSLLSDELVFKDLGFIVFDEQHKFGIVQRRRIREKGNNPDTLYMTATPIPRTLALTVFNGLALEKIKTAPSNRKKVKTYLHTYKDYDRVLDFVKSEIDEGHQAYFVSPAIEGDDDERINVQRVKNSLTKRLDSSIRIGLLHGKLPQEEKNDVLSKFKNKEIDILVSTTVIEVGIDNPNATVMCIIGANNFGLSTLHQLRGRVGRGSLEGFCFLLVEKEEDEKKLEILTETNDGFEISEQDLRDRGAGDFISEEQSGMLRFNFANVFKDERIFDNARKDAKELILNPEIRKYYSARLISEKFD